LERIFDLDPQLVADACITAINMFVLFLLGSYFLFNPVRDFLNKRKTMIKDNIDKTEADKEEADKLKALYEDKLKNVQKEADEILAQTYKKAKIQEEAIISSAKEEAERIIAAAEREALLEKQKVADDVKKEIVDVACAVAGKVVSANMDSAVQKTLIERTLIEMGDNTWRS